MQELSCDSTVVISLFTIKIEKLRESMVMTIVKVCRDVASEVYGR